MFNKFTKYAVACLATCAVAAPVAVIVGLSLERALAPAQSPTGTGRSSNADFWRSAFVVADYAEDYKTLKDMANSADAVVIGRITDVELAGVLQGEAALDVVVFAKLQFAVDTLVSGKAEEKVEVQFIVPFLPEVAASVVEKMADSIPDSDVMLFLRKGEAGPYRWVNDLGVWVIKEGQPTAPIALDPGGFRDRFGTAAGRYKTEIEGVGTLDEMAVALFK